jgi:hypothetical protein
MSGTTRFSLFATILLLAGGALVASDAAAVAQLSRDAEAFRSAGGATTILSAEGRVDAASCDALKDVPAVTSAGAVRPTGRKVTMSAIPDAPVPEYEVSPGFRDILDTRGGRPPGSLLSDGVADAIGATAGSVVASDRGEMRVDTTFSYPADGRRSGLGYAILSPTTADARGFDECWVDVWPEITNLRSLLLTTLRPGTPDAAARPQFSQLNATLGAHSAANSRLLDRPTRWAIPLNAAIATGLGYVSIRLRRLTTASALHARVAATDIVALHLLETAAWSFSAAMVGTGVAAVVSRVASPDDPAALLHILLGVPVAGVFGALLGSVLATLLISERQLFRYFLDR